ncbi:MAG: hypothetical protein QOE51_3438 [Actinoplanes sp.]|jgi:hypothetical protein|nr:hypothetical protein [Actinoplanes sp.]
MISFDSSMISFDSGQIAFISGAVSSVMAGIAEILAVVLQSLAFIELRGEGCDGITFLGVDFPLLRVELVVRRRGLRRVR